MASITHKCDLEGCTSGPHCTNRSSSPPFKTTLLYSFFLSGAVLTCAMFQGISERVGIDTKQMLIKDVRNETLFVATAQHLNWFRFHHRCTLTDQGSNAHFNMHPNWSIGLKNGNFFFLGWGKSIGLIKNALRECRGFLLSLLSSCGKGRKSISTGFSKKKSS